MNPSQPSWAASAPTSGADSATARPGWKAARRPRGMGDQERKQNWTISGDQEGTLTAFGRKERKILAGQVMPCMLLEEASALLT